jgi:hypothetical protein
MAHVEGCSVSGICGPAGARHCPWCKADADKFQNEKGDVLWHCHACYWTHTEARLLELEKPSFDGVLKSVLLPKEALNPPPSSLAADTVAHDHMMKRLGFDVKGPK